MESGGGDDGGGGVGVWSSLLGVSPHLAIFPIGCVVPRFDEYLLYMHEIISNIV